jgi:ADP-heptose:LPS heptosyltransferase
MKFLIIRFSSIGDIVLTTPVIRCLKQQVKDAEVHYVSKQSFKSILEHNPYIDKLHLFDGDWNKLFEELKAEKFDQVIDLHHNFRSLKIKRALKVPSTSFNKLNIEKWLLTNLQWNIMPDKHIVDRYLETVKQFGVENDEKGLDYFISEKDKVQQHDLPASHHAGFIGVVIGAALETKQLPTEKLKELCSRIEHPIILLGGPEDTLRGHEIASVDNIKVYNACGKFNLNESADLVRKAKFVITHDTGLMHIAAALKKPVISVWGNTVPDFGMSAYYGDEPIKDKRYEINYLRCRPCSKIGYHKCPLGHFKCMNDHSMNSIAKTAMEWSRKYFAS